MAHKEALDQCLREVIESGSYILGPRVREFEEHFARYIGAEKCIGVASGTDAVHLALRACGIVEGDGVITVSHTAVATVAAIDWIGARPFLVDIDPVTYTIDPQKVEDTLRRTSLGRIKAIIAVHLYGHPADMEALAEIADSYGIPLLEDCAQAHGATIGNRKAGTFGVCGAFSFYPTKNLGAFGDGGAVVTNDGVLDDRVRLLQQYGWRERYISEVAGYNSRLDELQAAILNCKLQWLDGWNDQRRRIAAHYNKALRSLPVRLPVEREGFRHVYHQYVIRCTNRDGLRKHLERKGIRTAVLYPMPIHQQPGYSGRVTVGAGGMDVTERIVTEILSLPIYPELTDDNLQMVVNEIRTFCM